MKTPLHSPQTPLSTFNPPHSPHSTHSTFHSSPSTLPSLHFPLSTLHTPDVLSCLANLSSDEVFTPPKIVNDMLNMLPQELFCNETTTFLDPVCKSGVFLREIAKRLLVGLETKIPDLQTRIDHIFHKQLFGIAITELTSLLSRRSVYCSKYPNSPYSITKFDDAEGNIRFRKIQHVWRGEKCEFCGASKAEYDREETLEQHAYEFIHGFSECGEWKVKSGVKEGDGMQFDVIIGNPPYQMSTQQESKQAKPIYNLFVEQAKKLKPRYLTMIIPARWFGGGMGLTQFRENMLSDGRLSNIVDYSDSRDCFSGVDIAGGICYFLWNREHDGECQVISNIAGRFYVATRNLKEFDTFIRYQPSVEIIRKIISFGETCMPTIISAVRPFGIPTKTRGNSGTIKLLHSQGVGYVNESDVSTNKDWLPLWKVITSKTSHDHAGQPDKDGKRKVLSRTEILEPNMVCTESYIVLGCFKTKNEAMNCLSYVKTTFLRFLVSLLSFSQDITREKFKYVPLQDFSESWTDEKLYAKYGLTAEEIAFIESMVRPMELSNSGNNEVADE